MRNLSNTFENAVLAACKVGFEYVSIDVLCIVQHNTEDWPREAATMAIVSTRSNLSFAVAVAADGTQGCFHARIPNMIRRVGSFKAKCTGDIYSVDGTCLCSKALS